ncbi:substrate-binding domain-containing protein [Paenibacillus sabinae]|uniref:D-ribose ABC transporter substrate-binding protein n=1 Tax=Paenibacillus sabinae T27 TaxID=1268072 RepID=X5A1B0_9BACL|nr:substrate-binding domain-containing protein [Paenibacillus sabinae]AHV97649.1 D-ribose ABC transporter substrate-binding protein [Paenibacillus sabinae T27]
MKRKYSKATKLTTMVLLLCMLGLTACSTNESGEGPSEAGAGESGKEKITIGVAQATLRHQFYIDINNGIDKIAKENGAEVLTNDPNLDIGKQVAAIEDFSEKKVDALILMAVDNSAVVPAVEEAKAKGIPVITADAVVKSDQVDTFIGTENYKAGEQLGLYFKKTIESSGKPAKIGVITAPQSFVQQERLRGFKDALKDVKGVTFLNEQPGYQREESLAIVENMLQANSDMNYIFATAEGSVLGALAALESANNQNTKILGFDVTKEAATGIKDGYILGMIQQQPELIGELAVKAALEAAKGETVEKQIDVPVILMDKNNVGEYFKD